MSKLAAKKKMLVAESEAYRQLLKLEIETFKVYGMRTKRRLTSFTAYLPWVMSGLPVLTRFFRKKRTSGFSFKRFGSLFLLGWKAYRQFYPLLSRGRFRASSTESNETAAQEYLAKRL